MGSDQTLHHHHVLLVSFPSQGHVNPLLRLAKHLASKGLLATFSSTHHIIHKIHKSTGHVQPIDIGGGRLRFESFTDGWEDHDDPRRSDLNVYIPQFQTVGHDSFVQLVKKHSESGTPVSCIISNPFIPWVSDVAAELGIPCALLWVQSCFVYSVYYHYFHNLASFPTVDQPNKSVELPGLPTLESDEIPSFLHPVYSPDKRVLKDVILGQFKNLEKTFCVLVDSFEELERESLKPLLSSAPIIRPIGPLYKWKEEKDVRGDMWSAAEECIEWLDSKPVGSVVYVSFGSVAVLEQQSMEEITRGLLNCGQPFLWVVRPPPKESSKGGGRLPDWLVQQADGKGLVVQWCPQERVLAHPSVACFITHCGWNSSMEILSSGVPIVAAPQWGDQVTNAKFLTDVYGVGVRLLRSENDLNTFSSERVANCIVEVTKGPKAEEFKKNALKWKKAADDAAREGGTSYNNLDKFVMEVQALKQGLCTSEEDPHQS
uniref:UDP-glucose dependent p-hydroxybenzoic acid glucosyltransferase n=1 Tax=Delphinium grandiflorum TaxID=85439 RepID=X5IXP9_DELGR|nr:UDP-glucose dependent p-hydroxybenzoic acid glucosyltransferase [Delphinium grandiflorum]